MREDLKTLARCYLGMLQGKVQELRRLLPATPAPDAEEPGNNAAMSSGEDGELMPEDAVREGGTTEAVAAGHGEVQTVIAKKRGNAGEASVEKKPRKRSPKDKRRKEGDDNCRICGEPGHWAGDQGVQKATSWRKWCGKTAICGMSPSTADEESLAVGPAPTQWSLRVPIDCSVVGFVFLQM